MGFKLGTCPNCGSDKIEITHPDKRRLKLECRECHHVVIMSKYAAKRDGLIVPGKEVGDEGHND